MQRTYALFDFDGTLFSGDSILRFCRFARSQGLCSTEQLLRGLWAAVRYVLGLSSAEQSKMDALHFIQGRSEAELRAFSKRFCEEVLLPRLRQKGLSALNEHLAQGTQVLLITASPSFYLEHLKDALGIDGIIGTRMDFDLSGNATGLICGENCKGIQKPLRLAEYLAATGDRLDYDSSYAYGDSASDLPMLELCGHKVGVNARSELKKKLRGMDGASFVRW